MRAVLQRVSQARVRVENEIVGAIGPGLLILLGVGQGDAEADARYLAEKSAALRIFEDGAGKMNLALAESGGAALVVSQFTLYADCRKGRRPGFSGAAPPDEANRLYLFFVTQLRALGVTVATGVFQADMQVELVNDGPVTMLLDSRKGF
ncbi:D-tyrosyl-tRNA(Tyr) deacylase [Desulfuromonas sp. DDH964]|uniref:D-aminoacyl-tRNA deacylase n=1 Tax=Desulfuromonas sp. DDH964 TaxID=1823759 RepID=UPI00078DC8E7|nr:D-aminoacyl-tRNA deacylase [Desulfuromonas sp. DDH964]AMV73793.1 D-tyrosyl-tRNA(Tyr) deacylase [Desulfuromonas sp. DDH964]